MQRKPMAVLVLIALVALVVFLIGNHSSRHADGHYLMPDTAQLKGGKPVVRIYMENSGSMDGFVTTNSQFKNALGHLIAKADGYYDGTKLFFINNAMYESPITKDLNNFVLRLSPTTMKVGYTASTDLNRMFKMMLDKTNGDTVSVFVSDCVYDVQNVGNLLAAASSATTGTFMKAIRKAQDKGKQFATIIMQCESRFCGKHFEGNTPLLCDGPRPYYVIIMGNYEQVADLNKHLELEDTPTGLPGLKHKYMLCSEPTWNLDAQTARTLTSGFTNARLIQPEHDGLNIHNIKTDHEADNLKFAVGLGVENLFADRSYLLDTANYVIEPKHYKITEITDKAEFTECDYFLHPIIIQINAGNKGYASHVIVKLKNQIPAWVRKCSYNKHQMAVPARNKSFALYEMVEGIYTAFHNARMGNDKDLFRLDIEVGAYE